ncbi:hypothetical protein Dsin_022776 [Dipteronia sinensis]|uniref:Large ribosomal subunit protein mL46 n=1 Tax=Dipteronia sinensis TaxID=43782 RepID=A0AAE0E090_9ROSI|nr:hypothetical protein Dsin_022776 [Dipteronia sinensis]
MGQTSHPGTMTQPPSNHSDGIMVWYPLQIANECIAKVTLREPHVCLSCRNTLSKRNYASTATAQATVEASPISQLSGDGTAVSPVEQPRILIKAGVVVSRPPLITPDPQPFETAYYLYQRRLNERLVLPFTQYFYYRRGTPAFDNWRSRRQQRAGTATRDIGKYNPYTKEGWNDEAVLGDDSGEPRKIVEQLIEEEGRADEFAGEGGDVKLGGLRRATEADAKDDKQSLERALSRTLYLLVKNKPQAKDEPEKTLWRFPSGIVEGKEGLKETAERVLGSSCGVNMNTWFVGNHPVGHYTRDLANLKTILGSKGDAAKDTKKEVTESNEEVEVEKTFFMKARIFSGQADVQYNKNDVEDFRWLTKQEIEKVVSPSYWSRIKNMLVEQ